VQRLLGSVGVRVLVVAVAPVPVSAEQCSPSEFVHWGADQGGGVFKDTATFVSQRNAAPRIVEANISGAIRWGV
jgi:hypothetical protein